jgi:hypothetical protein
MAKEALYVPEEKLAITIAIIRAGLRTLGRKVDADTRAALKQWCAEEEAYLRRLASED